jgi:hypothetical protein
MALFCATPSRFFMFSLWTIGSEYYLALASDAESPPESSLVVMNVGRIDHLLRAAANVTGQNSFVLVGSASVIVRRKLRRKSVPADMTITQEIDIYAPYADDIESISQMIDTNIGQGSRFHDEFGYYGDGVSPTTAKMPSDWEARAVEYRGAGCPDVAVTVPEENDVALAKLAAWRDKDQDWLVRGVNYGVLSLKTMVTRFDRMPEPDPGRGSPTRQALIERIKALASRCKVDVRLPDIAKAKPSGTPNSG